METDRYDTSESLVGKLRDVAKPLSSDEDLDPLLDRIGNSRLVLLGEASHGTSDYYTWRARLSKRLIREKGFRFIAVEGDWPDCYCINRYVKGYDGCGSSAKEALSAFDRWPTWMWANWEVIALTEWLRRHNDACSPEERVGFYGLDVYSLWESLDAVMDHLRESHPEALEQAMEAVNCFHPFNRDAQTYAWYTRITPEDCESEVLALLRELRSVPSQFDEDPEAHFNAEQNALVVAGAEAYYRAMVRGDESSWNIRDTHMCDTLDRLLEHHGPDSKAIVWEHNTHIGDSRYTDMAAEGMVNLGQLARERHGENSVTLVGFGSYQGSVIAGRGWGKPMEQMPVPPAKQGSWEDVMHRATSGNSLYLSQDLSQVSGAEAERGHRAIGVVYNPERERHGNYVPTVLPKRYDAFLFLDETRALHPLHILQRDGADAPETYPWGV
jgi:erythromycin esterase